MWDEADGFYYDVLRLPDGSARRLKVRSVVGLLPLCATSVVGPWQQERVPQVTALLRERMRQLFGVLDPQRALEVGKMAAFGRSAVER